MTAPQTNQFLQPPTAAAPQAPLPPGMPPAQTPAIVVQPPPQTVVQQGAGITQPPPVGGLPPGQMPGQQPTPGTTQVAVAGQTVLDGPDIPAEWRGLPVAQVTQMYNTLKQQLLQRVSPQQPIPQPAPAPTAPAAPAAGTPATNTQFDWRNPQASIQEAVKPMFEQLLQQLGGALQPVIQNGQQTAIQNARNAAAARIGLQKFAQLEPHIIARIGQAPAQLLADPGFWATTAYAIAGEQMFAQPAAPVAPAPGTAAPAGPHVLPVPALNSFFSEAPNGTGSAAPTLSAEELEVAKAFNMTPAQYHAWKGGVNGRA